MDLSINVVTSRSNTFDYVPTRGDNAIKYGVWYGGSAPLNHGANGAYIGDVARLAGRDDWIAAGLYDSSTMTSAADQLWIGGFRTRKEASIYLFGRRCGRDGI